MTSGLWMKWAPLVAIWFFVTSVAALGGVGDARAQDEEEPKRIKVESSNPLSGDEASISSGARLYFKWCVQCHGPKADGVSRFGAYAKDLRKFWRGYEEFLVISLNGRPKKMMPPWGHVLDTDELSAIGAYLETLAIEGAYWK
ncbi:MAG: cytochrome c [Alphaproteobacteria bacterium]|nr:cytochrome c [Alphaproteobacteria bacterium]